MPFPPIEEQEQIVAHIKTENTTIDAAKAEIEIELLKEYKDAMISEAVMGKIKITDGDQFPSVKRNN
jgi:type I restriction enzyme S subunit